MKKYLIYIALIVVAGLGVAFYVYNKPHENIKSAKTRLPNDSKRTV